jgi:hypothetical protein
MKRILILLAGMLLVTFAVAFGFSRARDSPPIHVRSHTLTNVVLPEERAVEVITLSPVIITAQVHRPKVVPIAEPPTPELREMRCGAWRALASDETQTVRYCEP